jgi:hypothetical protein
MSLQWRVMSTEKPQPEQECLVVTKHGIHQGTWSEDDQYFETYLFQDISFSGYKWIPIEEALV